MEHQPISQNLWWVIPGQLAGVRKPTADEIPELQQAGIGAIVSVLDDPSNLDLYQAAHLPHLWLPVPGGTAPSLEQLQELQTFIETQQHQGRAIALHCTNGRRRTGTVLAAYLVLQGLSDGDALQRVQSANPEVELREAQLLFLQQLAQR